MGNNSANLPDIISAYDFGPKCKWGKAIHFKQETKVPEFCFLREVIKNYILFSDYLDTIIAFQKPERKSRDWPKSCETDHICIK